MPPNDLQLRIAAWKEITASHPVDGPDDHPETTQFVHDLIARVDMLESGLRALCEHFIRMEGTLYINDMEPDLRRLVEETWVEK